MDLGTGFPFFLAKLINFLIMLIILSWVPLSLYALIQLRRLRISELPRVLWTALIIMVPYLGAIGLLIVLRDEERGRGLDR